MDLLNNSEKFRKLVSHGCATFSCLFCILFINSNSICLEADVIILIMCHINFVSYKPMLVQSILICILLTFVKDYWLNCLDDA